MNFEKQVDKIKEINDDIKETRILILKTEETIKVKEASMWLTSNWVQLLGKNRPTEKDKVFYINLDKDIVSAKRNLKQFKAELECLKNNYEIEMNVLKFIIDNK